MNHDWGLCCPKWPTRRDFVVQGYPRWLCCLKWPARRDCVVQSDPHVGTVLCKVTPDVGTVLSKVTHVSGLYFPKHLTAKVKYAGWRGKITRESPCRCLVFVLLCFVLFSTREVLVTCWSVVFGQTVFRPDITVMVDSSAKKTIICLPKLLSTITKSSKQ